MQAAHSQSTGSPAVRIKAARKQTRVSPLTGSADEASPESAGIDHRNEVVLVGRMSSPALSRQLPSGDTVTTWRLVVERPPSARRPNQPVDVVDCGAWLSRVRRQVGGWQIGDVIEVHGSLRRRFWRTGTGAPTSRTEVEVSAVTRLISVDGRVSRRQRRG
jgi:single-stranded DNA-binding protein